MDSIVRSSTAMGAALRRRRRALGLSQAELGERINARQATLSVLEGGTADTKLRTLMDVVAALGLEMVLRPRSTVSDTDLDSSA